MKKLLKGVINFYNTWYGIINIIFGVILLSYVKTTAFTIAVIGLMVIDIVTWYKNVFKNFATKRELFATIKQNNALCIYGGIGAGKSTMAEFILNNFIPPEKRYYNTNRKGFKAFTNEHLLLHERLEDGCGVLVDEAGGQADAYHYEKKDNKTRKRIDYLNKFARHWYTDKCLFIYVDQAQGNVNTSIYRNIYYTIQCKGLDVRPSAIIPHLISKIILFFVNYNRGVGKKFNNPFCNVSIEFMEFVKLGDYADHYSINIEDKDHKKLVAPIYKFFTGQNTYVFRPYNPAKAENNPYIWGSDKEFDAKIMNDNFNFSAVRERIQNSFND